jgi:tetratricopeptide (TPR) repeat protein
MFKRVLIIAMTFFLLTAINAQPPKNAEAVYQQGMRFMAKENYPDAMASFFKAVALYKNYDSVYFQMANINAKFNSYDTAIKFYKQTLAINPKHVLALINLATIYKNHEQDVNSALGYYLRAIAIDSTDKETLAYVAWCYNNLQHYDRAIPYAVKALVIDNNYKAAYGELGYAYHMSGKYADGIEQFKKIIAVSRNELPMFYCGLCYVELKDKVGAVSMYDELTKISSKLADALKKKIEKMEN